MSLIVETVNGSEKPFRSTVEQITGGISIVIPREWSWLTFLLLPAWLCFWAFALRETVRTFWLRPGQQWVGLETVFMTVWTGAWIYGGIATFLSWLWNFGGCETIDIDSTLLTRRRKIFGVGISKRFELSGITNVRFLPAERKGRSRIPAGIGFEYFKKTKRVARGLSEVETQELIQNMKQQFPQLSH